MKDKVKEMAHMWNVRGMSMGQIGSELRRGRHRLGILPASQGAVEGQGHHIRAEGHKGCEVGGMSKDVWKCACCGCQEPFPCDCPTDVAYSDADGSAAWKSDILKRNSLMNRLRWHAFTWLSHLGWWVCPEPHRSRLQRGIGTWKEVEARASRRPS